MDTQPTTPGAPLGPVSKGWPPKKRVKKIMKAVKADNAKFARYGRAFLLWASTVAVQVTAVGADVVMAWPPKRWALGFAIAAATGMAGLLSVGQKNQSPEELLAELNKANADRKPNQ